jgi:hypothetical protein
MNKIIDFMNCLTGMDTGWWPLIKCRPEKNEYIDSKVLVKITPFFGTIIGLAFIYLDKTYNNPIESLISIGLGWVGFFIIYRLSFSVAWNIRADRIKSNENSSV